jgi:glutaredoxin
MDTQTNKTVEIFSTNTCHFCHLAKEWLDENKVPFVDYNVGEDKERYKEMFEMTGQYGVPVIKIGDDVMVGFNPDQMAKLLEIPA